MKTFLSAVAIVAATAGSALSADLTADTAAKSAFDWSGGYVGLDAGYAWGDSKVDFGGFAQSTPDPDGWLGGAYIGYNFQAPNSFVIGLESDISGSSADDRSAFTVPGVATTGVDGQVDVNWTAAFRARVGYAVDRFLPYVAGGVAIADVDTSLVVPGLSQKFSDTFVGYTVGAGVEYAVTDNIIGRFEYRYTDFGSKTNTIAGAPVGIDTDLSTNELRLGVSFKF
jgi:outer membrane immunogenic protein